MITLSFDIIEFLIKVIDQDEFEITNLGITNEIPFLLLCTIRAHVFRPYDSVKIFAIDTTGPYLICKPFKLPLRGYNRASISFQEGVIDNISLVYGSYLINAKVSKLPLSSLLSYSPTFLQDDLSPYEIYMKELIELYDKVCKLERYKRDLHLLHEYRSKMEEMISNYFIA